MYLVTKATRVTLLPIMRECPSVQWTETTMPTPESVQRGVMVPGGTRIVLIVTSMVATIIKVLTLQKLDGEMGWCGDTFMTLTFIP